VKHCVEFECRWCGDKLRMESERSTIHAPKPWCRWTGRHYGVPEAFFCSMLHLRLWIAGWASTHPLARHDTIEVRDFDGRLVVAYSPPRLPAIKRRWWQRKGAA
jgi:hypothetical protein